MNRPRRNRYRSGVLLLAVGLLAAVTALAGIAVAKDGNRGRGSDRSEKRHHHHRHHHHPPTGTIELFDPETGRLVISLFGGETVGGLVTDRTKIKCEDEHSPDITHLRHGESEPGDDHGGRGEEESGDDHGVRDDSGRGPSGHDDNGTGANCTTSDLIVGAVVQEAELDLEHGKAIFDEVELAD